MIIKIYTDRMAEIIVEKAAEVPNTMDLARAMTMNGITAAKIVINSGEIETKPATGTPAIKVARIKETT